MDGSGDKKRKSSPASDDQVPLRQRRSGPVSDQENHEETGIPKINIPKASLSESLHKPVPLIQRAVSSEQSYDRALDQDADPGHIKTRHRPANGYIFPEIVTYSLHITFEGQRVSIHPNNLSSYEDIATKAEEWVNAQFRHSALAGRSVNFRHGDCTITSRNKNKSFGHIHTQSLSTDADWRNLCKVLAPLGDQNIHLDIHREYFGLLIQRVSDEKFAETKRTEIYNLMEKTALNGRYLPRSDLLRVASEDMVREIINDDLTLQPAEKEPFIQKVCKRAPKLLTMCVLARLPMNCLKRMLERGQDDNTNPLEKEHCCHQGCAQDFEDLLRYYRELNAATFFRPGEHQRLPDGTLLPIHYHPKVQDKSNFRASGARDASEKGIESDEENRSSDKYKALCGSGAYSNVYRVRLDPAHHDLAKDRNAVFALKEFRDRPHRTEADFKKELEVLNKLLRFGNEHIVHHLATWTLDARYYMLFPYAECNLRQYMERHSFSSPTKRNVLWLLAQLLGLSNALRGIHDISNPGTSTNLLAPQQGPRQSGWHHDLKPENILYFEGLGPRAGSFKIADFGSGKVHTYRSGTGSHNTRSPNGTLTYEPPEAAKDGATSRPYDVWSMGCVFVEMLIWVVYDYESVKSFRDSRDGKRFPDSVLTDDAFWQMDINKNPQRRRSVDEFLENLGGELQRRNLQTLQEVLGLVNRMLDTNKKNRITALHLWDTLKRIDKLTEVDLQAYDDDSLLDQNTPQETDEDTPSLSTKEPDR